ncbi:MAG: TonB-dependent receptor [Bacteroidales bacterium]|nr:TonB-dependent receptor [Bacteroidales bacterium]
MKHTLQLFSGVIIALTSCVITSPVYGAELTSQTIRGLVIDAELGTPLPGANVMMVDPAMPKGAVTDKNGEFRIEDVPVGRVSIRVSFIGYEERHFSNQMLSSGKELYIEAQLVQKIDQIDEVVVKAHGRKDKAINDMALISARSFSIEETERFAGSLGDPARMVSNYAGVMTQNDSRNDIIIRGNSPMGLLWKMDGIEVPNPNHFGASGTTGGPVSILNNNLLTNSDFYTGAFPASYGNALAGAFDLRMRPGNTNKHEYVGQVGFNGFELGAEGPFVKGYRASYLVNYRYSTLDVIKKLGFDFGTGAAVPEYQDLTYKIEVPTKKAGTFSFIGMGGISYIFFQHDTVSNSYNSGSIDTKFGSGLGLTALTHTYIFSEKSRLKTSVSGQYSNSYTSLDSAITDVGNQPLLKPYLRNNLMSNTFAAHIDFKTRLNTRNTFGIGTSSHLTRVTFTDSATFDSPDGHFLPRIDINEDVMLIKSFVEWKHKLNNSLSLYAGLYSQYFDLNNQTSLEPRLSALWQASNKQSVSFGFGVHSQLQPFVTYFAQSFDSSLHRYILTNAQVKFSKSNHYVLGYDYLIAPNLRVKAEAYYQNLYNIPVSRKEPDFSMLNAGDFFYIPLYDSLQNKGTGRNLGIDLTFERFLSNGYYGLLTASVFDSKYKGYNGKQHSTGYDGGYVVNALAGYEWKLKSNNFLTFDIKMVISGGKRYTPIDVDKSKEAGDVRYNWDRAYGNQHPYFRADVRFGYKINGSRANQEWAVDLQNVTNYENVFMEWYNFETNQTELITQTPFYPMFLYRINF